METDSSSEFDSSLDRIRIGAQVKKLARIEMHLPHWEWDRSNRPPKQFQLNCLRRKK